MTSEDLAQFAAVQRDFFDASEGIQSGIRADGIPVLMLTLTPLGVKVILDAALGWKSHQCPHAPEVGMLLLHTAADTLAPLLKHLPDEVQKQNPFGH